jgi:hypothetical protein
MKRCLSISVIITLSVLKTFGQSQEGITDDSLKHVLCHKWVISRMTMAGQPINSSNLATTYEFKPDYSVVCIWEKGVRKGVWSYDSVNQIVHLIMKKKEHLYLKSLSADEFELATELIEDPNALLPMKVYFRPYRN